MKTQALHPRASLQRLFMLLMVAVASLMVPNRARAAAPGIVTQPTSLTLNAGGTATFTVGASGTPSPTYQWFFNGSQLPGRTNTMLTFANAQLPQAGVYVASVSNIDGTVQSAEARLTILPPGLQQTWLTRFSSPDGSYAAASAMKVDGLGNVFVTGTAGRNGAAGDLATLKLNASGVPLWTNWYNGPVNGTEWGGPLAIDASGQAYTVTESGGGATSYDYATIKIGAGGNPLWQARFSATTNSAENPRGIAVDPVSGNVYVTGNDEGPLTQLGWLTVAYSSSGAPLWTNRFAGMGGWAGAAAALALDPSGNVLVAGYAEVAGSTDLVLIKYAPNGTTLWTATYDGPNHDSDSIFPFGSPMAVDAAGNVHVVGSSAQTDSSTAMLTVKFAANGSLLWAARDQAVPGANDLAVAVVLDSVGNVHVTGVSSRPGGQGDYLTRKYSAAGTRQWLARQPAEFAGISAEIGGLAVDASNQAYVAARMQRVPNDGDIALWRYDTNGNRRRFVSYNGPGNGAGSKSDWPKALHVGSGGQVFVAGSSYSTGSLEYVVIKYLDTAINGRAGILAAPQDQTVAPGATTTFSLIAEGTAPLFYQWLYFGRPISGATNSTLMLANVQTNQAGDYSVEVRNAIGETRSREVHLVVAVPPPPPLAHHWKFDESTGLLARDAVGEWHGTLVNGPTRIAGKLAGALAFDGVNDYVQIAPSPAPNLPAAFSLSLWFKPAQLINSGSGRKDLFKKYLSTWLLLNYPSGDGRLAFVLNAGSPVVKSTTSSWNAGQWYHVICTHDGTAMRIYVNGALEGTLATTAAPAQNANPIQIGGNTDQSFYFPGGLDDVRLYDAALSGTEVATLFNSGNDPSSLQSLINAAAPGATLNLPARTYFETVVIDKNLTLVGAGTNASIVDGMAMGGVVTILTNRTVTLKNLTVRNGARTAAPDSCGGGFYSEGSLTLSNVIVVGNLAERGGGICSLGPLTLLASQVRSNAATSFECGIYAAGPSLLLNSVICDNRAWPDIFPSAMTGGIGNHGTMWVEDCLVRGNAGRLSPGLASDGQLTLIGTEIADNRGSTVGGGVENTGGLLLMTNCTVAGNSTGEFGQGGGLINSGQAILESVIVHSNSANRAGGIWNRAEGTMTMNHCRVTGNTAGAILDGGEAGGVLNDGSLHARSLIVADNTASDDGGGIYNGGSLVLLDSHLAGNLSYRFGGGLLNFGTLAATNTTWSSNTGRVSGGLCNLNTGLVVNCTFSGNGGSGEAGAIFNNKELFLLNCTVTGNEVNSGSPGSPVAGGVFNSEFGMLRSRNSIIAGNHNGVPPGSTNAPSAGPDFNGMMLSLGYNLIGDTANTVITGDTTGNLLDVPPLLGPLQDNGGPAPTHALLLGSPAIDAGSCAGGPAFDQRGVARAYDFPAIPNAADGCDIGAFELASTAPRVVWLSPTNGSVFFQPSNVTLTVAASDPDGDVSSIEIREAFHAPLATGTNSVLTVVLTNLTSGVRTFVATAVDAQGQYSAQIEITFTVINELQALINAAPPGSTLNLGARTYFDTVVIDKNLTLCGVPGLTVLDGQSSRRVLQVATGAVVTICNTIIRNGNQREIFNGDGGGILNDGSLTLSNVIVTANTADQGGGISSQGPLTLLSSQVISNGARYYGNGIAATGPTRIYNSEVARNEPADFGPSRVGGIGSAALLWIENSRILSNLALDSAGIESSGTLVLIGSEVSGNAGYLGGSAVDSSGLLFMTNTIVSGNGGGDLGIGGGVTSFGQAVLDHVIVTRNRAPDAGGIWNGASGSMTLLDCTVTDNIARSFFGGYRAGGIWNRGTLTAHRTIIGGNIAYESGGGIVNEGALSLNLCRVENNDTYGSSGGGIHNSGQLTVTNTTLSDNRASGLGYGSGGGAGLWNSGTGLVVNCTISSNTLRSGAGGGLRNEGDITLLSCTLAGNRAGEYADEPPVVGGVFNNGTFRSRNSIIAGNANLPNLFGPLLPATGPDFNGVLVSQGFNLLGNTTDCIITGVTTGNLLNVLPALGPLQDNGGASPTHALQIGSPALDAGDPAGFPATDQRELPRPTDGNGDCVGRPDIGAYERQEKLLWIEQAAPGHLRLRLVGTAGRSYAIQRSVTLSPTSWTYLGLMQAAGTPCLFEFQLTVTPASTNQFFRAVELP